MDRRMRERIEKLLTIYLNDLESMSRDAGWHGDSTLGMMIEFRGDLPGRSGNDKSNAKMIYELRFLRGEHALLPIARFLLGVPDGKGGIYRGAIAFKYALPLLASRYYQSRFNDEIAALVGMELKQYEYRLGKARELMAQELDRIDQLAHLMANYASERGVMI